MTSLTPTTLQTPISNSKLLFVSSFNLITYSPSFSTSSSSFLIVSPSSFSPVLLLPFLFMKVSWHKRRAVSSIASSFNSKASKTSKKRPITSMNYRERRVDAL